MTPKRIRLSRTKGWRLPAGAVNVAPPGPYGNPFRVSPARNTEEAVRLYVRLLAGYLLISSRETLAEQRATRERVVAGLDDLRGKDLACWCPLDQPCHADVLLQLANAPLTCEAVDA